MSKLRKLVFSPNLFWGRNRKGAPDRDTAGLDFYGALREQSKCGFPMIDGITGRCVAITVQNGQLVVDGNSNTVENYCTFTYTIDNPAYPGSDTFVINAAPSAGETVVIDGVTYTWRADVGSLGSYGVIIGADEDEAAANLVAAITGGAGAGTLYSNDIVAHPTVTAVTNAPLSPSEVIVTTVDLFGVPATAIAVSETGAQTAWGNPDGDGTLGNALSTVGLSINGTTLANDPYEITSPGTSGVPTSQIAADIRAQFIAEGFTPIAVSVDVVGVQYVVTVTLESGQAALLATIDLERDSTAVTPVSTC